MTTIPHVETRSERGVALVIVLLLMAVLSGLATGFAMNGQVEATMAHNEVYYAGARAAAEAGLNRAIAAIRLEHDRSLLSGQDEAVNAADLDAAENDDNGDLGLMGLLTGAAPYALGDPLGQYSYSLEVLDDDDPRLYNGVALSALQLDEMCSDVPVACAEDGNPTTDQNKKVVIRATGFGPSNTTVSLSRILLTTIDVDPASTINPAILVDGDLVIDGNIDLSGLEGNVHANGDLTIDGNSASVSGDATASGDFYANDNFTAGGTQGGGYANVNVPDVTAQDFLDIADFILHDDGSATLANGTACGAPCSDWTWEPPAVVGGTGKWKITGNSAPAGTFYAETSILISGSPSLKGNQALEMTLISQGSIKITGSPILTPDTTNNGERIMFVANGDLFIGGNLDADIPNPQVEGQIFVKEQLHMHGNPEFQGRIIVQNDANEFDDVTENSIGGTPNITYEGTLPGYEVPETTTYTYNATGWIEQ
jgi:hypothetical protein